jgi:rare lipoprotein A
MQQGILSPPLRRSGGGADRDVARFAAAFAIVAAAAVLLLPTLPTSTHHPAHEKTAPAWKQSGRVSWYGPGFHGRRTASGEIFDTNALTMAHRTLPLGSRVRVTNLDNGRSIVLRVNDRGPYVRGRIGDLSHAAATRLGFVEDGLVRARIELI